MVLILVLRTSSPGNEAGKMAELFVNVTVGWTCIHYNEIRTILIHRARFFFFWSQGRRNGGRFKTSGIGDEKRSDLVRDLKINETPPTPIPGLINRAYFRFRNLKTLSRIKMFNKVLLIQRVMFVGITIEEWQAVFRHMASQHNNQCRMYSIVAVWD